MGDKKPPIRRLKKIISIVMIKMNRFFCIRFLHAVEVLLPIPLECKGKTGTDDLYTINNDVCRVNSDHAAQVLEVFRVV
jgi:hypothetical protein